MRMTFFTCHFNCPPLLTRSGDEDSRSNDATHVRTRIPRIRSSSRGSSSTCRWMIDRSILVDRSDSMQRIQSSRFESQFYNDRGEIILIVIVMIFAPSLSPCLPVSLSLSLSSNSKFARVDHYTQMDRSKGYRVVPLVKVCKVFFRV